MLIKNHPSATQELVWLGQRFSTKGKKILPWNSFNSIKILTVCSHSLLLVNSVYLKSWFIFVRIWETFQNARIRITFWIPFALQRNVMYNSCVCIRWKENFSPWFYPSHTNTTFIRNELPKGISLNLWPKRAEYFLWSQETCDAMRCDI